MWPKWFPNSTALHPGFCIILGINFKLQCIILLWLLSIKHLLNFFWAYYDFQGKFWKPNNMQFGYKVRQMKVDWRTFYFINQHIPVKMLPNSTKNTDTKLMKDVSIPVRLWMLLPTWSTGGREAVIIQMDTWNCIFQDKLLLQQKLWQRHSLVQVRIRSFCIEASKKCSDFF